MQKYTNAIQLWHNWLLKKINSKDWEVIEDFVWYIDYKNKDYYVIVPKWFITDFGSIPTPFRWIFDFTYISYILHDYLYTLWAKIVRKDWKEITPTRLQWDTALYHWLSLEWQSKIRNIVVYIALRIFWGSHYHQK